MLRVNIARDNPFDEVKHLAIAIKEFGPQQRHVGIFFRPDGEGLQIIHLGWHDDFRCHDANTDYYWIPCAGLDPIVLANIADWLSIVWQVNGSAIPYSIKPFDGDPFDETGKLNRRELGDGFTCATFVLWVFWHSHIELIDKESWRDRPEDQQWREGIIKMLRDTVPYAELHIKAQEEYINKAARYRPEEVAGTAGTFSGKPIAFDEAVCLGNCVLQRMIS